MRIVADENVDAGIVHWLRSDGHDVTWISEHSPGADDAPILECANAQQRVLVTFDLDFGELVFRQRLTAAGMVLLRLRCASPEKLLAQFILVWPRIAIAAEGAFVVATNRKVRVRALPPSG